MKQISRTTWILGGSVLVGGIIIGIVAGAVSGILFAPRSGEDTREQLLQQADHLGQTIKDKSLDILAEGKRQVSTALQHGSETIENALKVKAA